MERERPSKEELIARIEAMELPSEEEIATMARMTPEEKWAKAIEIHREYRQTRLRQLQDEHPEWTPEQANMALKRRLLLEKFEEEWI